ncbi:MAG: hypothetical protein LC114_13170 [Bryobacterales bacterium]|nr:hypothetical protein [Opitutaceae bacterium]MCZ2154832.1 hypothetical protein [Bryobacterales bacterium]
MMAGNPNPQTMSATPRSLRYSSSRRKLRIRLTRLTGQPCEAGNNCDPTDAINGLLATINPHADFVRSVIESGGRAEILVWTISSADFGEVFPSDVLLSLGKLGIGLSFDIYFDDPTKP